MHDGNDWTMLGLDNTANTTDTYIIDMMIINTFNINSTVSAEDNSDIITSHTTVSTTVNEGHAMNKGCLMFGDIIFNSGTVDAAG